MENPKECVWPEHTDIVKMEACLNLLSVQFEIQRR